MVLVVVSVRDSAVDAYSRPFYVPTIGMAVRSFQDEVNNPESPMYKHPADYTLFELATFDEDTGKFHNLDVPRQVMRGVDVYRKES